MSALWTSIGCGLRLTLLRDLPSTLQSGSAVHIFSQYEATWCVSKNAWKAHLQGDGQLESEHINMPTAFWKVLQAYSRETVGRAYFGCVLAWQLPCQSTVPEVTMRRHSNREAGQDCRVCDGSAPLPFFELVIEFSLLYFQYSTIANAAARVPAGIVMPNAICDQQDL